MYLIINYDLVDLELQINDIAHDPFDEYGILSCTILL